MAEINVLREVAPEAEIHPTVRLGRWCVVGPGARIGAGTRLASRVTVSGRTVIGQDNVIESGSVVGGEPQDLKYRGGDTWLLVGDRNRIGRNATVNVGTEHGGWVTYIGSDNLLGDACHVAHDCYLGDRTRLGGKVLLAGHIVVQAGAVIEDMVGIHHFARIGRHARIGPRTPVRRDVPPYVDFYSEDYYWDPPRIRGVHAEGIAAAGLDADGEAMLRKALADLFDDESAMTTKLDQLEAGAALTQEVVELCQFCRESLSGQYGRYRERFRGQLPPESETYLPADVLKKIQKEMGCG